MDSNLTSPARTGLDNQLVLPDPPKTGTSQTQLAQALASVLTQSQTRRDTLVQVLEIVLELLKDPSVLGPASTPSTVTGTTGVTPQRVVSPNAAPPVPNAALTSPPVNRPETATTPSPTGANNRQSFWTPEGNLVMASPGVFQTKFGTLVQGSGGNSNIYKRNGADENHLFYFDAKSGWQQISVEEYRTKSDEWCFGLADPAEYPEEAGQVYRIQASRLGATSSTQSAADEFLDVEGKKPIMTGSYSGNWTPSQAQIDWWTKHLGLPPKPGAGGTASGLSWWNSQALKMTK